MNEKYSYLAALLDAEGSVIASYSNNKPQVRFVIEVMSNTKNDFIEKVINMLKDLGLTPAIYKNSNRHKNKPHWKPISQIRLNRKNEQLEFISKILPFSLSKKEQLILMKDGLLSNKISERIEIRRKIKLLNKKGI